MALLASAMRRTAIDAGTSAWLSKQALKRQREHRATPGAADGPAHGGLYGPAGAATHKPALRDPSGRAGELRGLARLRDSGVITDEEFRARARRILGL